MKTMALKKGHFCKVMVLIVEVSVFVLILVAKVLVLVVKVSILALVLRVKVLVLETKVLTTSLDYTLSEH